MKEEKINNVSIVISSSSLYTICQRLYLQLTWIYFGDMWCMAHECVLNGYSV